MKLILVRHGDPDYPNDCLTPLGMAQAEGLTKAFEDIHVDALYSSPMGRARITAEHISRAVGLEPVVLDWLHELNGNYTGSLWAWNQHGVDLFAECNCLSPEDWSEHVVYGQHMKGVCDVFYSAFDAFMSEQGYVHEGARYRVEKPSEEVVAFACHAGVIQTLLAHLLNIPLPICYSQFAVDPSSRTTLVMEEKDDHGVFRLTCLNDMSHANGIESRVSQVGVFEE